MRCLYSFLFYLVLPFLFIRLWWRSLRLPDYRERLGERLGFYPIKLEKCIWVHAVSVGETIAAIPFIKGLKSRYPHLSMVVTTMTPTGAARVKAALGESVIHLYLPYDVPDAMARFLNTVNPVMGIIMETELWPNLLSACHKRQIPICLVNARLSEKSANGYRRIASLTREMLQTLHGIAAHGSVDADRFIALGAPKDRVIVTGNIKFDLELPKDLSEKSANLREALGKNRFIWIAASTHEGEEEIILVAHKKLQAIHPQSLLILVPRHPDRFDAVMKLCESLGFKTVRRSTKQPSTLETEVYLGDTMGELLLMYSVSDVSFVGGSLIERGGHNMLEPGALGKPILTGPHLFNFAEISELFFKANAMIKVLDANSLAEQLVLLNANEVTRMQMGKNALAVMDANRGALAKQLEIVSQVINSRSQ